jgi:hypothetical protein
LWLYCLAAIRFSISRTTLAGPILLLILCPELIGCRCHADNTQTHNRRGEPQADSLGSLPVTEHAFRKRIFVLNMEVEIDILVQKE